MSQNRRGTRWSRWLPCHLILAVGSRGNRKINHNRNAAESELQVRDGVFKYNDTVVIGYEEAGSLQQLPNCELARRIKVGTLIDQHGKQDITTWECARCSKHYTEALGLHEVFGRGKLLEPLFAFFHTCDPTPCGQHCESRRCVGASAEEYMCTRCSKQIYGQTKLVDLIGETFRGKPVRRSCVPTATSDDSYSKGVKAEEILDILILMLQRSNAGFSPAEMAPFDLIRHADVLSKVIAKEYKEIVDNMGDPSKAHDVGSVFQYFERKLKQLLEAMQHGETEFQTAQVAHVLSTSPIMLELRKGLILCTDLGFEHSIAPGEEGVANAEGAKLCTQVNMVLSTIRKLSLAFLHEADDEDSFTRFYTGEGTDFVDVSRRMIELVQMFNACGMSCQSEHPEMFD